MAAKGRRTARARRRRDAIASAAALGALFSATACGSGSGSAGSSTTSELPTTTTPTTETPAATTPTTETRAVTTATSPTSALRTTRAASTTAAPTTRSSTTSTIPPGGYCTTTYTSLTACAIPGRPLRRRRRRGLLLPLTGGNEEARTEYASVASFGELALRLLAVGAPADLVAACHEAALDEIRHASICRSLAGAPVEQFSAIPHLLGRRLGGWRRARRAQLRRLAVESFLDGWVNEGMAAAQLRLRADLAADPEERAALASMAEDEQGHAELAKAVVTWCFEQDPATVGRALARVAPVELVA